MLIELLSTSNYGHFNVKLAQIVGLESAVYLGELLNITEKAVRKNKVDGNFFLLDRDYIQSRTTFDVKKQEELDEFLLKIGLLERAEQNKNSLSVNIKLLTDIISSPDEDLMKDIKTKKKKSTKVSQKQAIADSLKTNIVTDNKELISAYGDWIDSVMAKDGTMNKKAVLYGQNIIDEFSNRNLEVALKVIEIATINGYRDMIWAVNSYKRNYQEHYRQATQPTRIVAPIEQPRATKRLSDEVF